MTSSYPRIYDLTYFIHTTWNRWRYNGFSLKATGNRVSHLHYHPLKMRNYPSYLPPHPPRCTSQPSRTSKYLYHHSYRDMEACVHHGRSFSSSLGVILLLVRSYPISILHNYLYNVNTYRDVFNVPRTALSRFRKACIDLVDPPIRSTLIITLLGCGKANIITYK